MNDRRDKVLLLIAKAKAEVQLAREQAAKKQVRRKAGKRGT